MQHLSTSVNGHGPVIVLLHGLFGSSDNLARIALELEKENKVLRVDLRNHGNSFHDQEINYAVMVEDVKRCMDYHQIETANFIGHSMGGKVAMLFALTFPEKMSKLIVADIAPVTYSPHHEDIIKGLQSVPLDKIENRREAESYLKPYIKEAGVRQFLLKSLDITKDKKARWKFNLKAIIDNYGQIISAQESTKHFDGQVLFIAGGLSEYIKPEYKDKILKLFPNAILKIIPETGHWLHAEKPKVFLGICQRFLKEQSLR